MQRAAARSRSHPVEACSSGIRPDPDVVGFRSPTYAIAKPLHLRPDLLAGELALELPDLLGIRLRAQPLQPLSVACASLCRSGLGFDLLPRRIPGRRNDRRLNTDALKQAQYL